MILVTVGTQLPFSRLIGAMDALAPTLDEPIIAQVGPDTETRSHIETHPHLTPAQFDALYAEARLIVAHAGVGSILSAKRLRRPLIIVPRRFDLGEHRNDHQLATAREIEGTIGVRVAWDMADLPAMVQLADPVPAESTLSPQAKSLIDRLRNFIG